jgi:hypothetical protein
MYGHCPICSQGLTVEWRVKEERMPGTVPEHAVNRPESKQYKQLDSWEEVVCPLGHRFKRKQDGLYGMASR